jgi:hypothetical protein
MSSCGPHYRTLLGIISFIYVLPLTALFWYQFLCYLVSVAWAIRHSQAWAFCRGVGFMLDKSIFGNSNKFCATLTPGYLAGRVKVRSTILWLVGVAFPPLEGLSYYKRQPVHVLLPLLLGIFTRVTLVYSRVFPFH